MKLFSKAIIAASVLMASNVILANDMMLDLTKIDPTLTTDHDTFYPVGPTPVFLVAPGVDANLQTGAFEEFGFSQLFATSIYDFSDGDLLGSFYDTNITSELTFANVPSSGTALDGTTPVSLVMPDCAGGQCDIDALSPLAPPINSDSEGFLRSWDLQVAYHFDGTLTPAGPVYTGGYMDVFFNSFVDDTLDQKVFTASVTGSILTPANLFLDFDITYALEDFLMIEDDGSFVDAADLIANSTLPKLRIDTNVNPPFPTTDQLLLVVDDAGNSNAIRQSTLDGSAVASIASVPEPATLGILGLSLLGLGAARKRKS